MAVLRRTAFIALLLLFVSLAAVFSYTNPDPISLDVGLARFENVSVAVAFAVSFGLGWVFGIVSAGGALMKSAAERRRLRRQLSIAEAELRGLRSLPLHDAN